MKKTYRKHLCRAFREEAGQALILILVFVLLGSITIIPTLAHMSTALKTGVSYEDKTNELYTADAGIENGIWRIKYDNLGPSYDPYDFSTVWSYATDPVNDKTAAVTVRNIWIPTNVAAPSAADARAIVEAEKLQVTGTSGAVPGQPYHIKIDFVPDTGENLSIKSIGIWLPRGFSYVSGSSSLEADGPFKVYYPDAVDVAAVPGGQSVVWRYDSPYLPLVSFPDFTTENNTQTAVMSFRYTPPADDPQLLPTAVAWVTTSGVSNVPLAWDTDTRIYKITSATGNTQIEAYSSKSQLRKLGDAIAGDYVAIGNSLMIGNVEKRDDLLSESDTTVNSIPSDADVISAILYWSGFRHDTTVWTDTCTNFDNWDRTNQTRVPISDNETSGTWNPTPASPATFWDKVDETSYNDNDYITGNVSAGGSYYKLFNFSSFTVPAGATISDITIYFRAKDYSSGNNNIQAYLKAGGTSSAQGSVNPDTTWRTYSYSYTTNPKTSAAWTVADVDGTGGNPLQEFGVYSSDLNPAVQVSMVYAQVNYSLWTIYNNSQFQGQGSSNTSVDARTITLKNPINLSSYAPGTIAVSWDQSESGTLEPTDNLTYALSSNNGSTWSTSYEAFHDDNPSSPFYAIVPTSYMTSAFKIRFYFSFDDSAEYVRLDNISVYYLPPDTSVTFKINDQQVYLDAYGNPQAGAQPLNATSSSVLVNEAGSTLPGFSYACHVDVSKLVKTYPVVAGEEHHTGNAKYTVGDVTADTGEYISYAGWSLIIIYSSPQTAGHYLYLHDVFSFNPGNTNLDFDGDGQPGGDITGFVLPEPIKDKSGRIIESVAANITCFVGEGDAIYTGDTIKITGQTSGASEYLSNSASPWNNVWNGASPGCSYPGIDVDYFQVLWADGILTPGDTRLHLDLNTGTDAWNLIYIILSVRSETVTSGTQYYSIHGS